MEDQYTDKVISCVECAAEFTHSAADQERYAQLGFTNDPKRCAPCRAAKKRAQGGAAPSRPADAERQYHTAVCARCGKEARVPFKPRGDRPVYCSDCFRSER